MRFMIILKANKDSEAGVMLAGEGLQASSKGARVRFSGAKRTVIDGPFPNTGELVAGYWIWQVKSKEEAIEIRQVFEADDFGEALTPELRQQEDRWREDMLRG